MSSYPKLNFPAVKLRASRRGERTLVWDDLRAMWLVLTPEEWVRRHLIAYLETGCGAARRRIVQEYPVAMNGAPQRARVVSAVINSTSIQSVSSFTFRFERLER